MGCTVTGFADTKNGWQIKPKEYVRNESDGTTLNSRKQYRISKGMPCGAKPGIGNWNTREHYLQMGEIIPSRSAA